MKKVLCIMLIFFNGITFSQTITIPDSNLLYKLTNANTDISNHYAKNAADQWIKIDINNDGQIQQSEALLVTKLYLNYTGTPANIIISNISGLESFTNLERVYLRYNMISNINLLATLQNLKEINARDCVINSINLNGLNSLEILECSINYLTQLDLSGLPNLKTLGCVGNSLSSLDLSNNPLLTNLYCVYNNITSINIKNGINHDFSNVSFNDCWKTGNPNLATICVDASELVSVQNHLNNCGSAQTINITSNCGLGSDEFVASGFLVYPNPSAGNFIIDLKQEKEPFKLELYTILGKIIFTKTLAPEQQNEIDITNLSRGCYIARISNNTKTVTQKIIKN